MMNKKRVCLGQLHQNFHLYPLSLLLLSAILLLWLPGLAGAAIQPATSDLNPIVQHGQGIVLELPASSKDKLQGSSATLLPEGKWLVLGGQTEAGQIPTKTARLYDPQTQQITAVMLELTKARAYHSATLLPDGRILVVGGYGASGMVLSDAEIIDLATLKSTPTELKLIPRSHHRTTLMVDGNILVTGGIDANGAVLNDVEIINVVTGKIQPIPPKLNIARFKHQSTLLPDHEVLISGGLGQNGQALTQAERYQPIEGYFRINDNADSVKLLADFNDQNPALVIDSLPAEGAIDVAVGQWLSVRFSKPVNVSHLTTETVVLIGPNGQTPIQVTPVEGGLVVFIKPHQELLPSANYTLMVNSGGQDIQQHPWHILGFKTQAFTIQTPADQHTPTEMAPANGALITPIPKNVDSKADPSSSDSKPQVTATAADATDNALTANAAGNAEFVADDESWIPGDDQRTGGHWQSKRQFAHSRDLLKNETILNKQLQEMSEQARTSVLERMQTLGELKSQSAYKPLPGVNANPALSLAPNQNALTGQVLKLNGQPLANVTLTLEGQQVTTNAQGEFVLLDVPLGEHVLTIDGKTANKANKRYGRFDYRTTIKSGVNALDFTIWMPRLDTRYAVKIPSPTTQEVVVTHPDIPGLEMRIPAGAVIRDTDGKIVTELSLTPIPVDQPPFPIPGFDVPVYFTVQPGGAHIETDHPNIANGGRIIYPNYNQEQPGARASFWNYDPNDKGWFAYGLGAVTPDGKQVAPDPGVVVHQFTGAMFSFGSTTPPSVGPPPPPSGCGAGGGSAGGGAAGGGSDGSSSSSPGPMCDSDGDPISLYTGLFTEGGNDLSIADIMPLNLARTYRQNDANKRAFGIGTSHNYELFLWSGNPFQEVDLILPDGGRVHYARTSPGTYFWDAILQYSGPASDYDGSTISANQSESNWVLKLKNGTSLRFPGGSPLASITDRYGNKTTLMRAGGATGHISRIVSPSGRWLEFSYDAGNRVKTVTDNIGRQVQYEYDAVGRLIKVTDAQGGITQYTYDANHRLLTVIDARGNRKVLNDYDANGRVIKQTYADNSTDSFVYTLDANSKVIQTDITHERGDVRRVTYNAAGEQLSDTLALGKPEQQTLSYIRDSSNRLTKITDPLGRSTEYQYDALGNTTKVTKLFGTAGAVSWTYTYEPNFNQVKTVTDPLGHVTTNSYDALGSLTRVQDPLGNKIDYSYTSLGQVATSVRYLGSTPLTTRYNYASGNLISVRDPLNRLSEFYPDAIGRIIGTKDPLGRYSRIDYDKLSRKIKSTDPQGKTETWSYDGNSNLLSFTDAKNQVTTFSYDVSNRLKTKTDALLGVTSYDYDLRGNVSFVKDRKAQITGFQYDLLNRRIQAGFGATSTAAPVYTSTITYQYDAANRLTLAQDSANGNISRSYDNRFDSITQETTGQGTVTYTYSADGQRQSLTPSGGSAISYLYDNAERLTRIEQALGTGGGAIPATKQSVAISYDTVHRPTVVTLPNGMSMTYAYDNAGQLTGITYKKADGTLQGDLTYTYNAVGARIATGGSLAKTELPTALAGLQYNADNRLTNNSGTAYTYDNNGNLTSDGARTYTWNARNQLTAISGGETASYAYDAFGRRRSATLNGQTVSTLYDGWNAIQLKSGATPIENRLTGLGLDSLFARTRGGSTESYLSDALGSTLELRNAAQTVTVQYSYDPYGGTKSSTTSTNTVKYTGRDQDLADLYYYRNRYYKPSIGRFISEDPIGLSGGSNFYAYVEGNPLNWLDPNGLAKYHYSHPHCQSLRNKINNLNKQLDERWDEYLRDPQNLPERIGPGEARSQTRRGHQSLINEQTRYRDYWQDRYDCECGDDDDNNSGSFSGWPTPSPYILPFFLIPFALSW